MKKFLFLLLGFLSFFSILKGDSCCLPHCAKRCWWDRLWVSAEFLYWKGSVSNSRVAVTTTDPPRLGNDQAKFLSYDWEPGVRASIGLNEVWCGWDLWGSYTYLQPEGSVDLTAATADTLIVSDFLGGSGSIAGFGYTFSTALSQKQTITYKAWEVLLSKGMSLCYFDLSPFFGVQGLFLDQHLKFFTANGANSINFDAKVDFTGVGLKTGFEILYPLCDCFNIFLTPSLSILYGPRSARVTGRGVTNTEVPEPVNVRGKGDTHLFLPGFDIQLGFSYSACWCNKLIGARVGWEFIQWNNVPQINHLTAGDEPVVLGFQGLTAGAFIIF